MFTITDFKAPVDSELSTLDITKAILKLVQDSGLPSQQRHAALSAAITIHESDCSADGFFRKNARYN